MAWWSRSSAPAPTVATWRSTTGARSPPSTPISHRYASGLRVGHRLRQGDLIGRAGSTGRATGPHLHYEVLVADRQIDPFTVRPIISAQAPRRGPFVLETGADGELGIGGPTTTIADAEAGDPPELPARGLGALPLEADGAMIRIDDLLRLRPEGKPRPARREA